MQDSAERQSYLLAIVANAASSHKIWVETSDATLIPEDDLYQRFQEISDQARVIFAPQASPLERLMLSFSPHWQAFVSQQQTTADPTLLPSPEFWKAWEAIEDASRAAKMPKLKRIESIAELIEQKVPRAQICKIYGFEDITGAADFGTLQEEIDEPGTHTKAPWVAPVNRHLAAQIRAMEVEAETLAKRRQAKIAAAVTPAPESIEQLVAGGVSAMQISRLKKISTDDVYQYCRQHNLPAPPYDYTGVLQSPGGHDPAITAERQAAMDNLGIDRSPQSTPPQHPMLETPDLSLDDPEDSPEDSDEGDLLPSGVDLSSLSPEEANQVQEASAYYSQGMDIAQIAASMTLHGNKVRSLLRKAGYDLERAGV